MMVEYIYKTKDSLHVEYATFSGPLAAAYHASDIVARIREDVFFGPLGTEGKKLRKAKFVPKTYSLKTIR